MLCVHRSCRLPSYVCTMLPPVTLPGALGFQKQKHIHTGIQTPWWRDEKYCIGLLTQKTFKFYVMNLLSRQKVLMCVPSEETLEEIQERYLSRQFVDSFDWVCR